MRARWHLRVHVLVLGWLVAAAAVSVAHRWVPAAPWLMVHLLLLGAVSTAILIWSAHFAEAVRRRALRGGRPAQAVRLGLHTSGALAVVAGLLQAVPGLVTLGGALVAVAALWHAATVAELARGAALGVRLGWTTWYFVASALALVVGVVLGVRLADAAAGDLAARLYVGHVLVMLLGWVGLTVVGTLVTLWPTMLRVPLGDDALPGARQGLAVLGVGLVVTVGGALGGVRALVVAGLTVYLAGLVRTALPLLAQVRRRRPEGFGPWSVGVASLWLVVAVVWGAVGVATASGWAQAQVRLGGLVPVLAVGFAAQVLLGSLSHLGPMVLGGGPAAVRAARAVVERGSGARLVLVNAGLVLFVLPSPSLVKVGASMLGLAGLVATLVLLGRAVVVSRRAREDSSRPGAARTLGATELLRDRPTTPRGPVLAAATALVLVVAGGAAADPASLGMGETAAAGVTASGRTVEVEVTARDMRFEPSSVTVDPGDTLVVVLTNADTTVHDLVLDSGVSTGRVAAGETARLDVGVVGRGLAGWCSVAGHRQMGMTFDVVVTGAATAAGGPAGDATADDEHGTGHDGATSSGTAPTPWTRGGAPGPAYEVRDATLPPAPEGTVHEVTLEVQEVVREVAPGVTQRLWTFGGTAPGPVLRGRVGDTFVVTLVNDGSLGHSVDFHAGALAPDEPMRTIEPGETLTYTFTATRSGVWMYHCSTMPMSLHIANGMAGAVVIDPPGLPPVDREYLLVQHELYLGQDGGIADSDKLVAERPDAVVFNGHATQYDHAPLEARVGERVRFWVLDAGPNRPSAFHVVGGQFDTVYLEGAWTLGGDRGTGTGGAQVLGLQPAQGGFVELTFPEAGTYPFVSHLMVDAERGAHGLVTVRP